MRCTKCSFISFDDLSACAKCANDLSHLSKELNGTCTETRLEFFLANAIQSSGLDEEGFSDSQMLPPIDHGDMNFDDTSTGGFSPLASSSGSSGLDFDDSMRVSGEDDVAIELGDIMPIDLDQLDAGSVLPEGALERTDALSFDDLSFDTDKTATLSSPAGNEMDLDLSTDFADSGTDFEFDDAMSGLDIDDSVLDLSGGFSDKSEAGFDKTLIDSGADVTEEAEFELDQELLDQLSDSGGNLDETISLNANIDFDATRVAAPESRVDEAFPLELDESLVAELAGTSSLDYSGEFPVDFSDEHSASGEFGLDDALVAELARDDSAPAAGEDYVVSPPTGASGLAGGFASQFEIEPGGGATGERLSFEQVEDLTGEFPPIREDDESEFAGLDLADIDVTDLVDPGDSAAAVVDDDSLSLGTDELAGMFGPVSLDVDDTINEMVAGHSPLAPTLQGADDDTVPSLEFDLEALEDTVSGSPQDAVAAEQDLEILTDVEISDDETSSVSGSVFPAGDYSDQAVADGLGDAPGDELSLALELPPTDVSLGHDGESADLSLPDIDALELDADFEAFLENKSTESGDLPETELIPEDDQDVPPDLPS